MPEQAVRIPWEIVRGLRAGSGMTPGTTTR
jgi:hypothetical protein